MIRHGFSANISESLRKILSGEGYVFTDSGATYTDGGTLTSYFNRKTSASDSGDVEIYKSPTVDDLGDRRGHRLILGGTVGQTTGATGGDIIESIIGKNTEFLIEVKNVSTATKDIGIVLDWHESEY